jgi:hypothetical protein
MNDYKVLVEQARLHVAERPWRYENAQTSALCTAIETLQRERDEARIALAAEQHRRLEDTLGMVARK